MKLIKVIIIVLLGFLSISGCASSSISSIQFIPYSNEKYEIEAPENILIVDSRLELKDKYTEIGALKIMGNVELSKILKEAAQNGAQGIIKDGPNYTLIIFKNKSKVKKNEIHI